MMTDGPSVLATALALVLTLGLAKFSFSFFEKPIIEFGHRFRYKPALISAAVPAQTEAPAQRLSGN